MPAMTWSLMIFMVVVLAACTPRHTADPPPLTRGMTEREVVARWGEPWHKTELANEAIWTYRMPPRATGHGPYQTLWFIDGRLR